MVCEFYLNKVVILKKELRRYKVEAPPATQIPTGYQYQQFSMTPCYNTLFPHSAQQWFLHTASNLGTCYTITLCKDKMMLFCSLQDNRHPFVSPTTQTHQFRVRQCQRYSLLDITRTKCSGKKYSAYWLQSHQPQVCHQKTLILMFVQRRGHFASVPLVTKTTRV